MSSDETILFLQEATQAFTEMKRTADLVIEHHKTCPVCRSRVLSFFLECGRRRSMEIDYVAAKVDAHEYWSTLHTLRMELDLAFPPQQTAQEIAVSAEWCEKLMQLEDDRVE